MPGSLPVLIQSVCMTALALAVVSRPLTMKLLTPPAMQFIALLTLAMLPVLFTPMADLNLAINTGSLSALSVLLLRSVQCAVFATAAFIPVVCRLRAGSSIVLCASDNSVFHIRRRIGAGFRFPGCLTDPAAGSWNCDSCPGADNARSCRQP